ncbi:MAG: GTP cyclohydrolase I, partial [Elusimicrobiales bacterium]|nr:GTP cyclohydrolase I [Elusimicrobiales bacterium]
SMCEHHMLPFFGTAHVAYIPNGKIIGLSKIPRLVEAFSKRMQLQERLTMQIANTLYDKLKPKGVGVVIEAQHLCMTMRGVKNKTSKAVTSSMLGSFLKDNRSREEFLLLIKGK